MGKSVQGGEIGFQPLQEKKEREMELKRKKKIEERVRFLREKEKGGGKVGS